MDFIEAERRYLELKRKYDAGALSAADFDATLRELMVQDAGGRWWAKSRDTGDWNYYDNATGAWAVAKPPVSSLPAAPPDLPAASPERRARRKEQPPAAESQEPTADFMPPVQLGSGAAASAKPGLDAFVAPAQSQPLIEPAGPSESFMPPVQLGPTVASAKPAADEFMAPAPGKPLIEPVASSPESFMPPVQLAPQAVPAAALPAARPAAAGQRPRRVVWILAIVLFLLLCLCLAAFLLLRSALVS